MVVRYETPGRWLSYDAAAVMHELTGAKAAALALTQMPYQRSWADRLQALQLKREVAGTSRIEGAEFTERELDAALSLDRHPNSSKPARNGRRLPPSPHTGGSLSYRPMSR